MNTPFRICVSSPPDRKKLVAEIFFGDQQWAELNQEQESLQLEFYPRPDGRPWSLQFELVISALQEAKKKLCDR